MFLPNLPDFLANIEIGVPLVLLITLLIVAGIAFVSGLPIIRMSEASAVISTLGLLLIFHSIVVGATDFTRGSNAFLGVPRSTGLYGALIVAVLSILAARLYRDSTAGLQIRAARDDEMAARSVGIAVNSLKHSAWVLSAMISAAAGVMLGHFLGAFSPSKFFFDDTLIILAMLIVGGMATISGAVAGTLLVAIVVEVLRRVERGGEVLGFQFPEMFGLTMSGICVLILGVMYLRPKGLFGRYEIDEILLSGSQPATNNALAISTVPNHIIGDKQELAIRNISKSFAGVQALRDVSFNVKTREIVGLIGPNGSGKTTLVNIVTGTIQPDAGQVNFKDRKISDLPSDEIARLGIGRTFQNIRLFTGFSVRQNVEVAALSGHAAVSIRSAAKIADRLLAEMDLTKSADLPADALAYGQRRRLEIARAMALEPDIVLFDEPAAGMNPSETDDLIKTFNQIREQTGSGILIIEHDLQLIMRLCDRIIVLNKGEIIATGSPTEIQKNESVIEAYLGPTTIQTRETTK